MDAFIGRSLAVLLGFGLAAVAGAAVKELRAAETDPRPIQRTCSTAVPSDIPRRLAEQAPARNELVLAELKSLGEHPWAGIYRTRGRWPTELRIAPNAGFTLFENSRCWNCEGWLALGGVQSVNGAELGLEVELGYEERASEINPDAWSSYGLEPTLHFVRWGELLFAVPPKRMELFCAEASDGRTFPLVPFRYLGNDPAFDHEQPARPAGAPEVPAPYQHLVLRTPVTCRLVALEDWRPCPASNGEARLFTAVYSIDAGTRDGISVGMRLHVEDAEWPWSKGRIKAADSDSATLAFLAVEEQREWAEEAVGHQATTLRSERKP